MATIRKADKIFTLINVFTVEPKDQTRLIELLKQATEETMRHLQGFISASIHGSFDGTRVVNYAQWRTQGDFETMMKHPDALTHMAAAGAIASFDPIRCEVVETIISP